MILRDTLENIRETINKISDPLILQEVECVTNAVIGNDESDDIKIWVPKSLRI